MYSRRLLSVCCQLPGVGITTAQQLLKQFNGSFDALWEAMLALSDANERGAVTTIAATASVNAADEISVENTSELELEADVDVATTLIAGDGAAYGGDDISGTASEETSTPSASASVAAYEAIRGVPGIGPSVLASLSAFAKEPANVQLIEKLRSSLTLIEEPKVAASPSPSVYLSGEEGGSADATMKTPSPRPLSGWYDGGLTVLRGIAFLVTNARVGILVIVLPNLFLIFSFHFHLTPPFALVAFV